PAQRRTRQADRDRIFAGNDADAHRATQPNAILREHGLVFIEPLWKISDEATHVAFEIIVSIVGHAADAPGVASKPRAELSLENLQNLFALAKRPEQDRHRTNIQSVRAKPQQM